MQLSSMPPERHIRPKNDQNAAWPAQTSAVVLTNVHDPANLAAMQRDDILARLREKQADLRARGVTHAALFGSIARGEGGPESDIDILVEIDPNAPVGLFEYVAITQYISDLFLNRVDVSNRRQLKPFVRPQAERDAIYAF
jgi:predicted nucleotidyltransferase